VPLRVLLCGPQAWADAIAIAWGGIAQQPLAIEVVPIPHGNDPAGNSAGQSSGDDDRPRDFGDRVVAQMALTDVAIVPCGLLPTLHAERSFAPLGSGFLDDASLSADRVLPVLRESTMRWAGNPVATPFGSVQPALLITGETAADVGEVPQTWDVFLEVARSLRSGTTADGAAVVGEPLAGGAAAKMFLWRASDAAPAAWLFARDQLEPLLTDAVYIQTLETMRACAEHYGDQRMTAGEVWNAVAAGQLKMAIAWPETFGDPPRIDSLGDATVAPIPRGLAGDSTQVSAAQTTGVMADPDAPIGLISSRCRQTGAAKRFLTWLTSGEGTEMVRDAAPQLMALRTASDPDQVDPGMSRDDAQPGGSSYHHFLMTQLSSIQPRPTLRLHRYDRYLAALDEQVLTCLDGRTSPAEALAATSDAWRAITADVGARTQAQAWRQAQGFRN
jgi:hypothetical protein